MTIKPGDQWGRLVARPDDLVTVASDRDVVEALHRRPGSPVEVTRGDLARTLGVGASHDRSGRPVARSMLNEMPIDLVEVSLDGGEPVVACAHVVARSPWHRGHWLRGPILAVMNAEFIGEWDVAPRGHPNDGRVEVFEVDRHDVVAPPLGRPPSVAIGDTPAAPRHQDAIGALARVVVPVRTRRGGRWPSGGSGVIDQRAGGR